MNIIKFILSALIIIITLKLIYNLTGNLDFNISSFLRNNFLFITITILLQIIGIFLTSLRWHNIVKFLSKNKNLLFNFNIFLKLTARANVINNFIPSIVAGDLSKLISPNKKKKKEELMFIFLDRCVGLLTLGNLGLISMMILDFIKVYQLILAFFLEIILILLAYKFKIFLLKPLLNFINKTCLIKLMILSLVSQIFLSLSLYVQVISLKNHFEILNDFFVSSFLVFLGIIPFSINGWGIREWSAYKIFDNPNDSDSLIIASIVFGVCISISNLLVYLYSIFMKSK